jgi:hypothetical protein
MARIHIRFGDESTADFSVSEGERKREVKLDGCYRADFAHLPEEVFEDYQAEQKELADEAGVELPRADVDAMGKFLTLYFCKEAYPAPEPVGTIVRVPDETVKSLDDALGEFGLNGVRCGRNYCCYSDHQYLVQLTEGTSVTLE